MLNISLNQLNFTVGDLAKNTEKLISHYNNSEQNVDLSVFSELSITSYPAEDLLLSKAFVKEAEYYQNQVIKASKGKNTAILFGGILRENNQLFNVAYFAADGEIQDIIYKNSLPNYGVFDEKRYFAAKNTHKVITLKKENILILICEDLWQNNLVSKIKKLNFAEIIILNASPYSSGKLSERIQLVKNLNKKTYYLNLVGGQDSLVFDGYSFIVSKQGDLVKLMPGFKESIQNSSILKKDLSVPETLAQDYNALILALKDYVQKNNFDKVVIGLSGGADSALVAVIAADALGVDKVNLVTMPSKYTSEESFRDAKSLIEQLNCKQHIEINIEEINSAFLKNLQDIFASSKQDQTEENLQARIRGMILMSLANKFGYLLLATSNKSESAVGYATLYGDMCGAYSLIKDIYKTKIYDLMNWRNENIPELSINKVKNPIAQNIITKEPTAELRANQKDTDSLPDYEILDKILFQLIEEKKPISEISINKISKSLIEKIYYLVRNSEYKRFQAAPGPKISDLSFDKERRMPLTNHYENI